MSDAEQLLDSTVVMQSTAGFQQLARRIGLLCIIALATIPCVALVGWALNLETLKRIVPSFVAMNPVTAMLFICAAAALMVDLAGFPRGIRWALSMAMIAVGVIKLQYLITGTDWGIDAWAFSRSLSDNRIAPNTATNFVLCGVALLILDYQTHRKRRPAQWLAVTSAASSILALLGYAYGMRSLYGLGAYFPMALHSALCFILLATAILCATSEGGMMTLITRDSNAGALYRRLLPACILVPALLGELRLIGVHYYWFDPDLGAALFAVMTMALFGLIVWGNSNLLDRSDARRHIAETALAEERNLLRSLIDNLPDHIYIKDAQGRYVTDNAAHLRFVGMSKPDDLRGKTVANLFPPALAEQYAADDRVVMESREPLLSREEPIVDRKGNKLWLATTKIPLHDASGEVTGLVCVSRDITRQRHQQAEMLELQNFLFSIIENIPNMVFVKEAEDLRFIRFNRAGEELLGYAREDLIGKNDYDFFPKDEADFFIAKDRQVLSQRRMVDIAAEPIKTRRGMRVLHTKKIPIFIEGQPRYLLGISEDITDRVQAEEQLREQNVKLLEMAQSQQRANDALRRAQAQMLQTEKLAAMGQLVAGVAHEINNPLSFVSNNVAVLQRDVDAIRKLLEMYQQADAALQTALPELFARIKDLADRVDLTYTLTNLDDMMHRSRDGLKRIQQIVKDLRDFARLDESDLHDCDLNDGISSTVNIIHGRAKDKQVELKLDLHPLPPITCYPAKINQVVMNLVSNAIDASNQGGTVTILTHALPDDSGAQIEVIDTGTGIEAAVRERIFDPFFTTKPQGEGTGLGLSISYGIIRDHKGSIEVTSTPGKGSKFTVTLPKTWKRQET